MNKEHFISKSCKDCESTIAYPINIPANTAFIYIAICINKTGVFNELHLLSQVKELTSTNPINILGDLKPLIPKIKTCANSGTINFHVETESSNESRKMFRKGPGYVCDISKCRIDFPGGPAGFQVTQSKEERVFYLGLENPSDKEDIWFHIEAVAVTRDY